MEKSYSCDSNNDGSIKKEDIGKISERILLKSTPQGNSDCNEDGIIDISDIITLSNKLSTPQNVTITLPGNIKMDFIKVPAGNFQMGSDEAIWSTTWEQPVHKVTFLNDFYIGKYEVTNEQWAAVMNANNPKKVTEPVKPAENKSWDECQAYIQAINALNLGKFSIPTESQWEYSARAGNVSRFCFGDSDCLPTICDECTLQDYAWFCGNNATTGAKDVGQKTANLFGLYDMHGNVMEWCLDSYHENYDGAPADGSAWISENSDIAVLRGGYWDSDAKNCQSSKRYFLYKDAKDEQTGFRLIWQATTK